MIVLVFGPGGGGVTARLMACVVAVEELLPQLAGLRIERVETSPEALRITAVTWDEIPRACPGCGKVSQWTHSRYVCHVADEAVGGRPLVIDLSVRRLYGENPNCPAPAPPRRVDRPHRLPTAAPDPPSFLRLPGA